MDVRVVPCAYLPPAGWFSLLRRGAAVEVCDTYQKQTPRSRCQIDTPQGPLTLTVPVQKGRQLTRDTRISDHGNWRHRHWQALVSSYMKSPYFQYYADELAPFYERRYTFLADFNEELARAVCGMMGLDAEYRRTDTYQGFAFRIPYTPPYWQVFGHKHGFLPGLSVLDLLFCMGPESIKYL